MPNTTRRDALRGGAALSSLLLASCSDRTGTTSLATTRGPRLAGKDDLTELERKFGVGPLISAPTSGNNFIRPRPDVHVVAQGPAAIRAADPNGLSWVLDPKITGPIEVGRVMVVTNRCAGRVLATRPSGDQVEVVFGPAELTDYIEEAKLSLQQPIDFSQGLDYESPDYPGAVTKVGGGGAAPPAAWNPLAPRASHAVFHDDGGNGEFLRTQIDDDTIKANPAFTIEPFFDPTTLGVQIRSTNDVINMVGDARLRFSLPKLEFGLNLVNGKIQTTVKLIGAAALVITFRAHSNFGVNGNIKTRHFIPVDKCIPVLGNYLPIAATFRHVFLLETAFSSKGNVDAEGQYAFEGALQMTFSGFGVPEISAPTNFTVQKSLAKSVSGVTFGPAGLVLAHQLRCIVGIGAHGFVTGPYVGLTSTAGITKGSSVQGQTSEQCRETTLRMSIHGGLGYQIPQSVANAINTVLSLFHVKGIPASGGISTPDQGLVNTTEHYPSVNACRAGGLAS